MKQKTIIHATLAYKHSFSNYLRYFLDHTDAETVAKVDFLPLKIPITFSTSLTIICCLTDGLCQALKNSTKQNFYEGGAEGWLAISGRIPDTTCRRRQNSLKALAEKVKKR